MVSISSWSFKQVIPWWDMRTSARAKVGPKGSQNALVDGQSKGLPFRTRTYSIICLAITTLTLLTMLVSFNSSAWEIITYNTDDVLEFAEIHPKFEVLDSDLF